jgi:hypothetical protein
MEYAVEMGPVAMIYILNFMKTGLDIQQFMGRGYTENTEIA